MIFDIIFGLFFSLLFICFSIIIIIFTVLIAKKLLGDINEDFLDKFSKKWCVSKFIQYIVINSEKEFPAFDLQDRKAICDILKNIHEDERWIDK